MGWHEERAYFANCARSCAVGHNILQSNCPTGHDSRGLEPSAQKVAQYCAKSCALFQRFPQIGAQKIVKPFSTY